MPKRRPPFAIATVATAFQPSQPRRRDRIVGRAGLPKFLGLDRAAINRAIRAGEFPEPVVIGDAGRVLGWLESDLIAWQRGRLT
jgi:predicted DNA-binding transcriptional regulator AlpA